MSEDTDIDSVKNMPKITASKKDTDEDVSDSLIIDLDSTNECRDALDTSSKSPKKMDDDEMDIMKVLQDEIANKLDDKAKQAKLTVNKVKNIIKQVLTYDNIKDYIAKEPRLTRAKAKELFSSATVPPLPVSLISQLPPSETNVLIGEDLKDDDSGEEYVPGEESGDDDNFNESLLSENSVKSPFTPTQTANVVPEVVDNTLCNPEEIFKKPSPVKALQVVDKEAANIALRTRSKINLSATPLEEIEQRFFPPDITRDMYDTKCDDAIWQEFLKDFSVPLQELTKPIKDDDDPEYNIVADDEINQIDNESDYFIDDADVNITDAEIEELWDGLLEYVTLPDLCEDQEQKNDNNSSEKRIESTDNVKNHIVSSNNTNNEATCKEEVSNYQETEEVLALNNTIIPTADSYKVKFEDKQMLILKQQMRQHVQMLTQNFLLMYENPELHDTSCQMNEYLLNLKYLSDGDPTGFYKPINLEPALNLINKWIEMFKSNSDEVKLAKEHVEKQISLTASYNMAGNSTYIPTFPDLLLKTISKSQVFMYPFLLPKIPFRSRQCFRRQYGFTDAEDSLLVFAINEFKTYLEERSGKSPTFKTIIQYVHEHVMPHRDAHSILKHVHYCKHPRCSRNPIRQYMLYNEISPVLHYLYPLNDIVAPACRLPHQLPHQWKIFLFPEVIKYAWLETI